MSSSFWDRSQLPESIGHLRYYLDKLRPGRDQGSSKESQTWKVTVFIHTKSAINVPANDLRKQLTLWDVLSLCCLGINTCINDSHITQKVTTQTFKLLDEILNTIRSYDAEINWTSATQYFSRKSCKVSCSLTLLSGYYLVWRLKQEAHGPWHFADVMACH